MKYLLALIMVLTASLAVAEPVIMPFNAAGEATNSFEEGDDIYLYGLGFEEEQEVDIYLLEDKDSYETGSNLENQALEKTTVTTTQNGFIRISSFFSQVAQGVYDFIVDIGQDNTLSEGDVLNAGNIAFSTDNETEHLEEPVEEVPEFSTILAFVALIGIGLFVAKKRRENQ